MCDLSCAICHVRSVVFSSTVVSPGDSSSPVVWSLPSVVSSVPSFAPMMSAPTQSFSQHWCPPCPSLSSSASLIPPSSFRFSFFGSFFVACSSSSCHYGVCPFCGGVVWCGLFFGIEGGRVRHLPILFLLLTWACRMRRAFSLITWSSGMATSQLPRVRILMLLVNQSHTLRLRKSFQ